MNKTRKLAIGIIALALLGVGAGWYALSDSVEPGAFTNLDSAVAKRAFEAMMQMNKIDIAAIEAAVRG